MKGKISLLFSCVLILLCLSIIGCMTYALFTDTRTISHHLKAGDLAITLKRVNLEKIQLSDTGYLETVTNTDTVDFSASTRENVFDIRDEKIVPGCKYVATMQIENHSDVAFGYWVEIVCTDQTWGAHLANQIKVTVTTDHDATSIISQNLVVKGENDGYIAELSPINEQGLPWSSNFTVSVEFLDSFYVVNGLAEDSNNAAQREQLEFDLIVHAVQVTDAP